jgi:hypothetical protein
MSDERIERVRQMYQRNYNRFPAQDVQEVFVWDDIGLLLERIAALEYQYRSGEPGTQGQMLAEFYGLLTEQEKVSAKPGPLVLKERIAALEAVRAVAAAFCDRAIVQSNEGEYLLPGNTWALIWKLRDALAKLDTGQGETGVGDAKSQTSK